MKRTIVIVNIAVAVALSIVQTMAIAQGPTPEQEAALRQIEAFSNAQAKSDPHYLAVEAELLGRIDEMVKTQPPAAWAPTVRRWYFSLSERAHSEERDRIRGVERAAAGRIVAPSPAAPDKLADRLEVLAKDLRGGKLSPREHALHALEAARAIFPSDTHLITMRETKVALATDYELGNITRGQYDERWARARAGYQQNADARQQNADARHQRILDEIRAEQAAAIDRIRGQRGIRCTSTTAFGTTTTTCR